MKIASLPFVGVTVYASWPFSGRLHPIGSRLSSDVDVLVTFEPGAEPTRLRMTQLEEDFAEILRRRVDLVTSPRAYDFDTEPLPQVHA